MPHTDSDLQSLTTSLSKERWRVNKQISLGDILVFIGLVGAGFSVYTSFDKRISYLEYNTRAIESNSKENFLDLKLEMKEISKNVSSMQTDIVRMSVAIDKKSPLMNRKDQ